ncbi:regulatory protein, tetR family [Friedmanniella luteola]|uniref:Regulatory protein, tetR family n=1 Tax=Friedmanniella luteola TaxID=546871 RepID=A0A1H1STA3_9ACTN|nr:TetR/AcrR family transcriptional regulator [Friedmanniella luteola]SDS51250.1 regulatory protein, tetR family [Friedmanniella luteola]
MADTTTRAGGVRAQAREQMRTAILETARAHLADHGAVGLSLRAVARDVGMVSSAVYRYFPSRDALLTALIIDAYDSLGSAVERAEARVPREDLAGRWRAVAVATRGWARADPHQYALVYGSPVPGYAAPQDTVGPATRVARLLADLLVDIAASDGTRPGDPDREGSTAAVDAAVQPVARYTGGQVPTDLLVRGVMAWTYLFGAVSFELFGQRHQVIAEDHADDFFAEESRRLCVLLGIADD